MSRLPLRHPRTTAELRAACGAQADGRDGETPPLRNRPLPSAWDDRPVAAGRDRSRRRRPRRDPRPWKF